MSGRHLLYEIQMLQETAKRLLHDRWLHSDAALKNAMVESCVLHARVLTGFLYPDNARADDVTSYDYVVNPSEWAAARGSIPAILITVNTRMGKEIAHLTMRRRPAGDPEKQWSLTEIIEALHVALKKFVAHAALDRLHEDVGRFITSLRPPMETVTLTVFESGSTDHPAGGAALICRCHRSSATVQSFCFTFSHRRVAPPSYTLRSSLATYPS